MKWQCNGMKLSFHAKNIHFIVLCDKVADQVVERQDYIWRFRDHRFESHFQAMGFMVESNRVSELGPKVIKIGDDYV